MTSTTTRQLVSAAQAAEMLSVTPRTIRRYAAEGVIPAWKLPGRSGSYVFEEDVVIGLIGRALK